MDNIIIYKTANNRSIIRRDRVYKVILTNFSKHCKIADDSDISEMWTLLREAKKIKHFLKTILPVGVHDLIMARHCLTLRKVHTFREIVHGNSM